MNVFLDTNVVIDFYDQRGEFYYPAAIIFDLAYKGNIKIFVSATTFVNAFFILRKSYTSSELYQSMRNLAALCEITEVDENIINKCLEEERKDFEDSVQYESSKIHQADIVITRNIKDFKDFASNIKTPNEFLDYLSENITLI